MELLKDVQEKRLKKVSELFELLDSVDQLARGEARALHGQITALKLAIDTRLRLMEYDFSKAAQKQEHSGEIQVRVVNYGNNDPVSVPAPQLPDAVSGSV